MDESAPQQESEKQQSSRFLTAIQMLDRIENWLTSVFELSAEEQEDAGIYLGNQGNNE